MRFLLCVDGPGTAELIERAGRLVDLRAADLIGLHVADTGPRDSVEFGRRGFPGAGHFQAHQTEEIAAAARDHGQHVLGELAGHLAGAGLTAELIAAAGGPERVIVETATGRSVDLIVLFAHRFGRETPPGPRSIGHTARFVLDHAPCPVLLLR